MRPITTFFSLLTLAASLAATSASANGGTKVPPAVGGVEYGQPTLDQRKSGRLRIKQFSVTPNAIPAGERTGAIVRYRIDSAARQALNVRVDLLRSGEPGAIERVRLKNQTARRTHRLRLPVRSLEAGAYTVRLLAQSSKKRRNRRVKVFQNSTINVVAPAAPAPTQSIGNGFFPVRGPYVIGDGFGVNRGTHKHEGQDISAAMGTPVIAPRAGTVSYVGYQEGGAGNFVVIQGVDGRAYVFMHLLPNSIPLAVRAPVAAGQQIGAVGSTGRSSGPHLHFEIWVNGWRASPLSQPIDPLADLRAWGAGGQ